jgi:diacylglycerol kinase family enzyme
MTAVGTVHLVINPVAGGGSARDGQSTFDKLLILLASANVTVTESHVMPLLAASGYTVKSYETQSIGDAATIARDITQECPVSSQEEARTVILAGGDGTMHELMEGIYDLEAEGKGGGRWNLIMIPVGTVS